MTHAEILTIGDELLIGQTVNTNQSWIGTQLSLCGIQVVHAATVSDEKPAIVSAIDAAFSRAELVVVTGGLGPTKDDITKKVLADYFDSGFVLNEKVLAHIESFFRNRKRPMLEVNRLQAMLPDKCRVLPNQYGTAAGMWFEKEGRVLISMPGVPFEMQTIFSQHALPAIKDHFGTAELYHKTVLTQGVGESFLADELQDWENEIRGKGFGLAYLPSPGSVKLRITSYHGKQDAPAIDDYFSIVRTKFPLAAYGEESDTLASVIGRMLLDRGQTIGTAESCTGGAIGAAITSVPGSSAYYEGSVVTYSYRLKEELLGVSHETLQKQGAVSCEVVRQMANGVRERLGTDWGIAVSGIAGPDGGTPDKPVGTVWIGIAGPGTDYQKLFTFGTHRGRNIQVTVDTSLNLLRALMSGLIPEKKQS